MDTPPSVSRRQFPVIENDESGNFHSGKRKKCGGLWCDKYFLDAKKFPPGRLPRGESRSGKILRGTWRGHRVEDRFGANPLRCGRCPTRMHDRWSLSGKRVDRPVSRSGGEGLLFWKNWSRAALGAGPGQNAAEAPRPQGSRPKTKDPGRSGSVGRRGWPSLSCPFPTAPRTPIERSQEWILSVTRTRSGPLRSGQRQNGRLHGLKGLDDPRNRS